MLFPRLELIANTPIGTTPGTRPSVVRNIICKDGTKISVQASSSHYCGPRTDEGPWHTFGVLITPPRRTKRKQREEGWMCMERVKNLIRRHGGELRWDRGHYWEPPTDFYQRRFHKPKTQNA